MANPILQTGDGVDDDSPVRGDVKRLQALLCQAGYEVEMDGRFGPRTDEAVRRFQKESGLPDRGVVSEDTWESLEMASAARPANAKWPNLRMNDGYANTTPHLRPAVVELQKLLNQRGAKLDPDGFFGPKTDAGVREFQKRHSIPEYGVVGPRTWSVLHFERIGPGADEGVGEARAVEIARESAEREGWSWSAQVAVLDKVDRWRVVSGGGSIIVEVDKSSAAVVLLERSPGR